MKWAFTVEGQPPSVKHSYRIVRFGKRMGLSKVEAVERYQLAVKAAAVKAKPKDWQPGRRVRVRLWFHVGNPVDADNMVSAILDGLKWATEVDDKIYLPCVEELETGFMEPQVVVEVE